MDQADWSELLFLAVAACSGIAAYFSLYRENRRLVRQNEKMMQALLQVNREPAAAAAVAPDKPKGTEQKPLGLETDLLPLGLR